MGRCEDEQMWRWEDVKMGRCEDEQMWRWADVKMRCEDERMWRWDVKMRRCLTDPHYWKNPALRRAREKESNFSRAIFLHIYIYIYVLYIYNTICQTNQKFWCFILPIKKMWPFWGCLVPPSLFRTAQTSTQSAVQSKHRAWDGLGGIAIEVGNEQQL